MKTHLQIRQDFLNFFKSKGHVVIPSGSVVPMAGTDLLFTNAGMNPFKDIFLGLEKPSALRVCNTQKCIRVSGKHNDLEEVGTDTTHHTFFEMLGNWSFGDYYKRDAIAWAWELLTDVWKLPKEKLYATVHNDDHETYELWNSITDINKSHVLRFGDKDNFWEMGAVGPCGPCTEIHIDLGEALDASPKAWVNSNSARYVEIWNLVFIQNYRNQKGEMETLQKKYVDTGMGFERIVSILQGKQSNYDTDVFQPILRALEKKTNLSYDNQSDDKVKIAMRVIADHIRTLVVAIADGVTPSNESRGYVLRRLLRRAYRYGKTLGLEKPFLHELVPITSALMSNVFPELNAHQTTIQKIIFNEESLFSDTLNRGLELFDKLTQELHHQKKSTIQGKNAFKLYDTYGFPFDFTCLLAKEKKFFVDEEGFLAEMKKQKKRSQQGTSDSTITEEDFASPSALKSLLNEVAKKIAEQSFNSKYWDETYSTGNGKLLLVATIDSTSGADSTSSADSTSGAQFHEQLSCDGQAIKAALVFDETVFYGEGGGQVGDVGVITSLTSSSHGGGDDCIFKVMDTKKIDGRSVHLGQLVRGSLVNNQCYMQQCDKTRKQAIRKNHTATHLLHQALRSHLGNHVRQAGSFLNNSKLRFDFNHYAPLTTEELNAIEKETNEAILQGYVVCTKVMSKADADKLGAVAFFEDKYGDEVRVVNIATKGKETNDVSGSYSIELCGGSHVDNTAEIGIFKIVQETSSASGVRRIEAITGRTAYHYFAQAYDAIVELKKLFDATTVSDLMLKADKTLLQQKHFLAVEQKLHEEEAIKKIDALPIQKISRNKNAGEKINFLLATFSAEEDLPISILKNQIDAFKDKNPLGVVFVVSTLSTADKVLFLCGGGKLAVADGIKAGELVKIAAGLFGGKGGGKSDFAQGGAKISKIDTQKNHDIFASLQQKLIEYLQNF